MTWASIFSGLLSILRTVARWIEEGRIRADERRKIELETYRRRDDVDARVDDAVNGLRHDNEAIRSDRFNRRRTAMPNHKEDRR
jgi:hypothetical protein